jgi:hypothetical protein
VRLLFESPQDIVVQSEAPAFRAFGVFFQISKHPQEKIDVKVLNLGLRVIQDQGSHIPALLGY